MELGSCVDLARNVAPGEQTMTHNWLKNIILNLKRVFPIQTIFVATESWGKQNLRRRASPFYETDPHIAQTLIQAPVAARTLGWAWG